MFDKGHRIWRIVIDRQTRNWALTSKLCQWSEKWQKPINWQDWWSLHCWVISRLPPLERLFSRLFGRREAAKT
jgi:hypothetical protein